MANVLVKQIVGARTRNVVTCDDSILTTLTNELVGKVEVYTEKGSSGALTLSPEVANKQRYSVGSKMGRVYTNCSFTVPHVKTTVSSPVRQGRSGKYCWLVAGFFRAFERLGLSSQGVIHA